MIGVVGVVAVTIVYFMLSLGKIDADGWWYPFINLMGAGLIVFSLIYDWNLAAFLMETSWVAISLFSCVKFLTRRKRS